MAAECRRDRLRMGFSFLKEKRAEGKFHKFGISIHDLPEFTENILTEHPEIDFMLEQINYIAPYRSSITRFFSAPALARSAGLSDPP